MSGSDYIGGQSATGSIGIEDSGMLRSSSPADSVVPSSEQHKGHCQSDSNNDDNDHPTEARSRGMMTTEC